ncbi:hypothetical protein [Streptomyces griseorubiginosus]|uniref:hypothetical protein n=1 Tax=Streptomyces griseorubiginosus TaxID=67304 RepID=UPI0033178F0C
MSDTQPTATVAGQSIALHITGYPDVPNRWGTGHIRVTGIRLDYGNSRTPDGRHAFITGVWVREDGEITDAPVDRYYDAHDGDTSTWPEWIAELARKHTPAAEAQPEAPWATDSARIGRVLIWSHTEIGRGDFGRGYWAAQEEARNILTRPLLAAEAETPQPGQEQRCTCGGTFPIGHLHADTHDPAAGARQQPDTETLAALFEGFGRLLSTSSRDWGQYAPDAWLWAVICGWDCEETTHSKACVHDVMEEMQQRHGWSDEAVAKARRYRAAVRALTEPTDPPAADADEPRQLTPCTCRQAVHAREHEDRPVDGCTWCMPDPDIRPNRGTSPAVQTVDARLLRTTPEA